MPVETKTAPETTSDDTVSTAPPDTITDDIGQESAPVEDPMVAVTREARAFYEQMLEESAALEAEIMQLMLDANLNFAGKTSTAADVAAQSGGTAMITSKLTDFLKEHIAARLTAESSLAEDATAEDYLHASRAFLNAKEDYVRTLHELRAHVVSEPLAELVQEKIIASQQDHVDALTAHAKLEAKLSQIETLREDRTIVEGLIDAFKASSTGG